MEKLPKCKITILKTTLNKDIIDKFIIDEYKPMRSCERFKEGQEFIIDPNLASIPENFCDWAWADIRKDIMMVASGTNLNWLKQSGTTIVACTDWFRPVYFKIERIDK